MWGTHSQQQTTYTRWHTVYKTRTGEYNITLKSTTPTIEKKRCSDNLFKTTDTIAIPIYTLYSQMFHTAIHSSFSLWNMTVNYTSQLACSSNLGYYNSSTRCIGQTRLSHCDWTGLSHHWCLFLLVPFTMLYTHRTQVYLHFYIPHSHSIERILVWSREIICLYPLPSVTIMLAS